MPEKLSQRRFPCNGFSSISDPPEPFVGVRLHYLSTIGLKAYTALGEVHHLFCALLPKNTTVESVAV